MQMNWISRVINRMTQLILCGLLIACAPNLLIHTPTPNAVPSVGFTLSGNVTRGQLFTQTIAPNLTFQLLPLQEGWEIWVGNPQNSSEPAHNFAMPVTPPFTGINARQIEGWHFRNLGNSGPNLAGEQNVNAPQELRPFCFVGNNDDFQTALDALASGMSALALSKTNKTFPLHSGTLTITEYTLGNLLPNQKAWIEEMFFTVILNLDQDCDLF